MIHTEEVDRLLFGFNKLDFLDFPWLQERMGEANPEFDGSVAANIKEVFPELQFPPTWLAQAWSLYTLHALHREPVLERSEVAFLYFILGLQVGWPKETPFTEKSMRLSMKEGATRAKQVLKILDIFH